MKTLALAALLSSFVAGNAQALEISYRGAPSDPRRVIALRGSIEPGDAARIRAAIRGIGKGKRLVGFTIISDGGEVTSSFEIISLLDDIGVPLMVVGDCFSACGFIAADVAAHGHLYLSRYASVAVHRDFDEYGRDDITDSAVVARLLHKRGVPVSITRKIESTPSSYLADITADLRAMGAPTD
jgi:hypothetical protein